MTVVLALSASQRRQRNLAVALLVMAVCVLLSALVLLWWRPWSAARDEANQLAERQARAQALIAQRDATASALEQAEQAARQQPLWLPEASAAQAIDGMAGRVDQAVALISPDGQRCKVQSRNPVEATASDGRAQRASLALRLRCGNAELLQLLHLLETSQPPMLVDEINISAPPQYPGTIISGGAGVLDVGFNVTGYVQTVTMVDAP